MTEQQLEEIKARAKCVPSPDELIVISESPRLGGISPLGIENARQVAEQDVPALIAGVRHLQVALNDTLEALHDRHNCDICQGAGGAWQSVGAEGEDVSWESCECADFAAEILEKYDRPASEVKP